MDHENNIEQAVGNEPAAQLGLRSLLAPLAAQLAAGLSGLTGREVKLTLLRWEQSGREQFLSDVCEPTCCGVLNPVGESSLPVLFDASPQGAGVLIEALLGGLPDGTYVSCGGLTAVEQRLFGRIVAQVGQALTRAWPVKPAPSFEMPSACGKSGEGADYPAISMDIALSINGAGGKLRMLLPQVLLGGHTSAGAVNRSGPVELSVTTDDMIISESELATLADGDILTTDTAADGEVIVRVAGIPKYRARLGTCDGRRAITILGPIKSSPDDQTPQPPTA